MVSVLLFIAGTVTAFTANIRAAHGDETDPYGILPIGLHYDFEIDAKTGETWKGLMPPVKDRYFLEPKTILIEPFHGEGDLIWTYVSTETRPIPEFLVRGSLLKEGPVDFVLKASFPYQQRFYQELNLPPEIGTPILEYTLLAEPNPPGGIYSFELTLAEGQLKQTLMSYGEMAVPDGQWNLWAGDLDGDDKLDIIIDTMNDPAGGRVITLYLSTKAQSGQIVGEARHRTYNNDIPIIEKSAPRGN